LDNFENKCEIAYFENKFIHFNVEILLRIIEKNLHPNLTGSKGFRAKFDNLAKKIGWYALTEIANGEIKTGKTMPNIFKKIFDKNSSLSPSIDTYLKLQNSVNLFIKTIDDLDKAFNKRPAKSPIVGLGEKSMANSK